MAEIVRTSYAHLSPELRAMFYNELLEYPVRRPCSNNLCCLINYSIRPRPKSATPVLLSIDRQTHSEIMTYQLFEFDIYFIHGRVTVCLGYDTGRLRLQSLPLLPSMRGTFTGLVELWIVAGTFSFRGLNNITPYLDNLRCVNLEHDMTEETSFTNSRIFLVDYCNNSRVYHYPPLPAQPALVTESKEALRSRYQLSRVDTTPMKKRDLRWFLARPENRPVAGVQIIVHLRCPMRLCNTCVQGGTSGLFKKFEKKMTIRYDFDTMQVLSVGWAAMM